MSTINVTGNSYNVYTSDQLNGKKNKLEQLVKEMGLKEAGINIYTTLLNDGVYYVWNPSNEQMEQLPPGNIGRDGNYTSGSAVNSGTLQAHIQGYNFTDKEGVYNKGDKLFTWNTATQKFDEVNDNTKTDDKKGITGEGGLAKILEVLSDSSSNKKVVPTQTADIDAVQEQTQSPKTATQSDNDTDYSDINELAMNKNKNNPFSAASGKIETVKARAVGNNGEEESWTKKVTTGEDGSTTIEYYDSNNVIRKRERTLPSGETFINIYDESGNREQRIHTTEKDGHISTTDTVFFDAQGNYSSSIEKIYDANGCIAKEEIIKEHLTIEKFYDTSGNLRSTIETEQREGGITVIKKYDSEGRGDITYLKDGKFMSKSPYNANYEKQGDDEASITIYPEGEFGLGADPEPEPNSVSSLNQNNDVTVGITGEPQPSKIEGYSVQSITITNVNGEQTNINLHIKDDLDPQQVEKTLSLLIESISKMSESTLNDLCIECKDIIINYSNAIEDRAYAQAVGELNEIIISTKYIDERNVNIEKFTDIITHEIGHLVDFGDGGFMNGKHSDEVLKTFDTFISLVNPDIGFSGNSYFMTSMSEFLAEYYAYKEGALTSGRGSSKIEFDLFEQYLNDINTLSEEELKVKYSDNAEKIKELAQAWNKIKTSCDNIISTMRYSNDDERISARFDKPMSDVDLQNYQANYLTYEQKLDKYISVMTDENLGYLDKVKMLENLGIDTFDFRDEDKENLNFMLSCGKIPEGFSFGNGDLCVKNEDGSFTFVITKDNKVLLEITMNGDKEVSRVDYEASGNLINVADWYINRDDAQSSAGVQTINERPSSAPITDSSGKEIGMIYYNEDGTVDRVEATLPDGTKQTTYSDGSVLIEQKFGATDIVCKYSRIDGQLVLLQAISPDGTDKTEYVQELLAQQANGQAILNRVTEDPGYYGTGANFDKNRFINDLINDAEYELITLDKLSNQQIYDILINSQGDSFDKVLQKLKSANYNSGGTGSSTNNSGYGQTGGQSFGFGDHGFDDVFGNNSYSDGYHMDFWGNWVHNSFGGSPDGYIGNHHTGGGGSVAHY